MNAAPLPWLPLAALLLASAGCGSTATIERFQTFADTGTRYTQAVGVLLTDTSGLLIDANSVKLLESRQLAPVSEADFRRQDDGLRRKVDDLRRLQRQADLLGHYFSTLASLAGSQASDQISEQLADLGTSLASLAETLGSTDGLATDANAVSAIAGQAGKLVIQGVQAGALRNELEARGPAIAEVLRRQADLLQALAGEAAGAQGFLDRRDYDRNVVDPFLAGEPLPAGEWSAWMAERKDGLTQAPIPDSLRDAVQAAAGLRVAWVSLLAGELDADELEAVAQPLASIDARQETASRGTDSSTPDDERNAS